MSRYIITAPEPFTGSGYGLIFVNGKAVTESGRIAQHLAQKGYVVEEQVEPVPTETEEPEAAQSEESKERSADGPLVEQNPTPRRSRSRAAAKEAPPPEGTDQNG